jgi:HPt (histidine-containing phosphotransfer) domain-containing protein
MPRNPLDEAVIGELESIDDLALPSLLSLYFDQAAGDMSELSGAIGRGETLAVGQAAHKVKGSSSTVGAAHAAHVASVLEATAKAGDLTTANELLDRLRSALDETREAFRTRLADPDNKETQ